MLKLQSQPRHEQLVRGKLKDKVALITGGDSGVGRAVAVAFAREGAMLAINYLEEHQDAKETKSLVESYGAECILLPGDVGDDVFCRELADKVADEYGAIDILVNNAGRQPMQTNIGNVTPIQLERAFRADIFAMFYLCQAALRHIKTGGTIINNASSTAYYSATKGAVVAFTQSLALSLAKRQIRVNAVAAGPILEQFGPNMAPGRTNQPEDLAPAFLFLASNDALHVTGQVVNVNEGQIINA